MHKRTKPAELINCRCDKDVTGSGPGRMFKVNATNCKCTILDSKQITNVKEFKVRRVAVSIG